MPGLGSKEAHCFLLYQRVTGYLSEKWLAPDGRYYSVYEYFLGGEWTTTTCFEYYFPGQTQVPTEEYKKYCTDIPRRIKMLPKTIEAFTEGPTIAQRYVSLATGPYNALWLPFSSSFLVWTDYPSPGLGEVGLWPPSGYKIFDYLRPPFTVGIYSRLDLCRMDPTTGYYHIVRRGASKLVIQKTFG